MRGLPLGTVPPRRKIERPLSDRTKDRRGYRAVRTRTRDWTTIRDGHRGCRTALRFGGRSGGWRGTRCRRWQAPSAPMIYGIRSAGADGGVFSFGDARFYGHRCEPKARTRAVRCGVNGPLVVLARAGTSQRTLDDYSVRAS